jgi:hypothetical protein
MRTDICAREDVDTQSALLNALGSVGAMADEDTVAEVPFAVGLHRFTASGGTLTVFVDAWGVDLEGPDELARRVLDHMTAEG